MSIRFEGVSGRRLSVDIEGDWNGPPVLLLCSARQPLSYWGGISARLGEAGFLAVTVEPERENGGLSAPEDPRSAAGYAADVCCVADQVGGKVALVGCVEGKAGEALVKAAAHLGAGCTSLVLVGGEGGPIIGGTNGCDRDPQARQQPSRAEGGPVTFERPVPRGGAAGAGNTVPIKRPRMRAGSNITLESLGAGSRSWKRTLQAVADGVSAPTLFVRHPVEDAASGDDDSALVHITQNVSVATIADGIYTNDSRYVDLLTDRLLDFLDSGSDIKKVM